MAKISRPVVSKPPTMITRSMAAANKSVKSLRKGPVTRSMSAKMMPSSVQKMGMIGGKKGMQQVYPGGSATFDERTGKQRVK